MPQVQCWWSRRRQLGFWRDEWHLAQLPSLVSIPLQNGALHGMGERQSDVRGGEPVEEKGLLCPYLWVAHWLGLQLGVRGGVSERERRKVGSFYSGMISNP